MNINDYTISGIGSATQLGKGGPSIISMSGTIAFVLDQPAGTTITLSNNAQLSTISIATPTNSYHASTKLYVDSITNSIIAGSGLTSAGSYSPNLSYYIASATSLNNADYILDQTLHSITSAIISGVGLTSSGLYSVPTTTNYLNSSTSVINALDILDGKIYSIQTQTVTSASISAALGYLPSPPITSTAGTYNSVVINSAGQVLSGVFNNYLTTNQTISLTGDITGTGNSIIPTTLAATGVTAGTYNSVVVNAKGLVTSASHQSYVASFNSRTGAITLTSSDVVSALGYTPVSSISSTVGTYNNVVINSNGQVVSGSEVGYLTSNQTITFTGAATGSGTTAVTLTLIPSGVSAGTYNSIVVNSAGIVVSGSNVTSTTDITLTGDVTGSGVGTISTTLSATGVTAGTYNTVVVNAKGLVTSASETNYLTTNQNITFSGAATGSGTTAVTLTLTPSGVSAGTYNTVVVNIDGIVTSALNVITVDSFNTRTGAVTLNSSDVLTALGYTPLTNTAPIVDSFNTRTGAVTLELSDVTTALGYTPLISSNPIVTANLQVDGIFTVTGGNVGTGFSTQLFGPTSTATAEAGKFYITWNATNSQGETDFILTPQTLEGGLNIYFANSSGNCVNPPVFELFPTGNLSLTGTLSASDLVISGLGTIETPTTSDNSTYIATTAFVKNQNYLTTNQSITITGDAYGTGTTAISLVLANSGVSAGTYSNVVVNAKGIVTSGNNTASQLPDVIIASVGLASSGSLIPYSSTYYVGTENISQAIGSIDAELHTLNNLTYRIENYGGVGDGVTDNSGALIAAAASGNNILFGPHTYMVSGETDIPSDVNFFGVAGLTIIKRLSQGSTGTASTNSTTDNTAAWIYFSGSIININGIIFDGNTAISNNSWGVVISESCLVSNIENCQFINVIGTTYFQNGLSYISSYPNVTNHNINKCFFSGNSLVGLLFNAVNGITVKKCYFFNNGQQGLLIDIQDANHVMTASNINICNNTAYNNSVGIQIGDASDPNSGSPTITYGTQYMRVIGGTVSENYCYNNTSYNLTIAGSKEIIVENNTISGTGINGNCSTFCRFVKNNCSITGNVIGIDVGGTKNCVISDNAITGSYGLGIAGGGSILNQIINNYIYGNATCIDLEYIESGSGGNFGVQCSDTIISDNMFYFGTATGIIINDNCLNTIITNNKFFGTSSANMFSGRMLNIEVNKNSFNNLMISNDSSAFIDANGILVIPELCDTIELSTPQSSNTITKILTTSQYNKSINGPSDSIAYITIPTNSQTNILSATVNITGNVTGATANAFVYGGVLIGINMTNNGSGYTSATATAVCTISGSASTVTLPLTPVLYTGNSPLPFVDGREIKLINKSGSTIDINLNGININLLNNNYQKATVINGSLVF